MIFLRALGVNLFIEGPRGEFLEGLGGEFLESLGSEDLDFMVALYLHGGVRTLSSKVNLAHGIHLKA